jgi:peptide subunit release factor 1 (eRF1)
MDEPPRRTTLSRLALLRLLDALDQSDGAGAGSLYLPAGHPPDAADHETAALLDALGESVTGTVAFAGEAAAVAVAPPFPLKLAASYHRYATEPLREELERPRALGVILVRLGGFSVGFYRDGGFVDSKTGGRFVKNRNRKGGQSQRRFERIREGQIREHFDDVAEVVRAKLLPLAAELDWVVLGGDRRTVQALLKRAPLPAPLAAKLLPRVLDTPEPRRDVLERTPGLIWSSRVVILRDPRGDVARAAEH